MSQSILGDQAAVFEVCAEIEEAAAEIYRCFQRAHADSPSLAAIWEKTAQEEDNHARQFRMTPRVLDSMVAEVVVDLDDARQALALARKLLSSARAAPPEPAAALRLAIQMEQRFADFHMSQAAVFKSPSHAKLFSAMMAADRGHAEQLQREYQRYSSPPPP